MRRTLFALTAAVLLSGCSFLGFGEPEIAGDYRITTQAEGQSISASVHIVREGDAYSGSISSNMSGPFTIQSVTRREAGGWLIRASGMEGRLEMRMTLEEENRVSGTWSLGTMGGTFSGERVET